MTSNLGRVVMDGTYLAAVREDRRFPAFAAGERASEQLGSAQRDSVCGRAGLQMARPSRSVRQLAHDLRADEPLGQKRRARPGVREAAGGADRAHQDRGVRARLDLGEGPSGRARRAKKKRTASHRQVARRMEHQDSYGYRECSNGHKVCSISGQRPRRARGSGAALGAGADAGKALPADGSCLPGRRNPPTGARPGHDSGGAAEVQSDRAVGVRPRPVQETQPDRAALPQAQRLPPHLLPIRETRRRLRRLSLLRAYRRGTEISVKRPSSGSSSAYAVYPSGSGGYTAHSSLVSCCGEKVLSVTYFGYPICYIITLRDPQIQEHLAFIAKKEPLSVVDCNGYIREYLERDVATLDLNKQEPLIYSSPVKH